MKKNMVKRRGPDKKKRRVRNYETTLVMQLKLKPVLANWVRKTSNNRPSKLVSRLVIEAMKADLTIKSIP